MAKYTAENGTKSFEPDDAPDKLHINGALDYTMHDVFDRAREHFGADVQLSDLKVEAEHIQTRCLGYDQYDPGDYDVFIVLTREA